MSAVDQHAEAHRLKDELGYGARRIGRQLGITRYAAEQLLRQPPSQIRDPRLDAVVQAIIATVPYADEADTWVTVEHRYTQGGRRARDTWTGTAERLAERILTALDTVSAPAPSPDLIGNIPRLIVELRSPVDEDTARSITTALAAMIRHPEGVAQ